jgi:hypothetical protein
MPIAEGEAIVIAAARSAGAPRKRIAAAANAANSALCIGELLEILKAGMNTMMSEAVRKALYTGHFTRALHPVHAWFVSAAGKKASATARLFISCSRRGLRNHVAVAVMRRI